MIAHRRSRLAPLRYRSYRRLWLASFISDMGDAVGRIALTILVQRDTGSPLITGSVVVMYSLPFLGFGQWATAKLANIERRRLLVTTDLIRAACFAAMVLPVGIYPRLALLLAASLTTPPFEAVAGAAIAKSVPERVLGRATGLRTAATEFAFVAGFAVGGLVADITTPTLVIGFDALTFLVSALIIARTEVHADPDTQRVHFLDGVRELARHPLCRRIVLLTSVAFALVLVPESLVAAYTDEVAPDATGATGVLASTVAIGVIVTTLLRRPEDSRALVRHASVTVLVGAAVAAIAFAGPDRLPVAGIGYLALGPVLAIRVHAWTVMGHEIEDRLLAPAFSVASGALSASYLVAGLVGGGVAELIGVDSASTVATTLAALIGLGSLVIPVRARVRAAVPG